MDPKKEKRLEELKFRLKELVHYYPEFNISVILRDHKINVEAPTDLEHRVNELIQATLTHAAQNPRESALIPNYTNFTPEEVKELRPTLAPFLLDSARGIGERLDDCSDFWTKHFNPQMTSIQMVLDLLVNTFCKSSFSTHCLLRMLETEHRMGYYNLRKTAKMHPKIEEHQAIQTDMEDEILVELDEMLTSWSK